jgi:hypothetical protein
VSLLVIDGFGTKVPHGYRVLDVLKVPRKHGETDLSRLSVSELAAIGIERVCDPAQEGDLFGEVEK